MLGFVLFVVVIVVYSFVLIFIKRMRVFRIQSKTVFTKKKICLGTFEWPQKSIYKSFIITRGVIFASRAELNHQFYFTNFAFYYVTQAGKALEVFPEREAILRERNVVTHLHSNPGVMT